MPALSMGPIKRRTTPGWEMFHRYDVADDSFQLFIRLLDQSGQHWVVEPFTITKQPRLAGPTLSTSVPDEQDGVGHDINGFLQAALELAWEIGLRPQGYADPSNELSAVRYHLEDMRKLAKVTS